MSVTVTVAPEDVLWFWLGDLDGDGLAEQGVAQRWWRKDAALDQEIHAKFEATWQAIMAGDREAWLRGPHSRLAYVIVLDQFSRNMFRGSAQAFAGDERALAAAAEGVERGMDRMLHGHERVFFYMPYMHSEQLAMQDRALELFSAQRDQVQGRAFDAISGNVDFARRHRDVIVRFGRFPHRNAAVGRESTPEEVAFLKQPGSSF
ncbi:MAG TPA: DUF924 family protein [Polyangiales bacterium]|nr:DUF924 family protein [Polyangiales bacterium]